MPPVLQERTNQSPVSTHVDALGQQSHAVADAAALKGQIPHAGLAYRGIDYSPMHTSMQMSVKGPARRESLVGTSEVSCAQCHTCLAACLAANAMGLVNEAAGDAGCMLFSKAPMMCGRQNRNLYRPQSIRDRA